MENITTENASITDLDQYIRGRYVDSIEYYRRASRNNKRWYKLTRALTVIFGALVTLIASLSSSKMITPNSATEVIFTIGTPILAAMLTIIAGFSQNFQWGSAWQNMVLTAQQLQKEYDHYIVTPADKRDYQAEVDKLNNFIIEESESFFERMLGGVKARKNNQTQDDEETQSD